jgi:uncharacterized protein YqgC (DUF456 family)
METMRLRSADIFKHVLGYTLIVVGILGLILPILPGWWVILLGLEILGWKLVIHRHKPWKEMIEIKNKHKEE